MQSTPEKPYVGVTGISSVNEARLVVRSFVDAGLTDENSTHRGMIGLLTSQRTLSHDNTKTPKYPALHQIREIFLATQGRSFNTLHFSTYKVSHLTEQLTAIMEKTGIYHNRLCHGVQLNISWPPAIELEKSRTSFPSLKIILQLGPRVLSEKNAEDVAEGLINYEGLIDYVLIDPSGGKGTTFEPDKVAPLYNGIKDLYPNLPVVFAGGFNPENVKTRLLLLSEAIEENKFSIDAEAGLRTQKGPSSLSIPKVAKYIHKAASFFKP